MDKKEKKSLPEPRTYTVRIKPYSPYAKGGQTLKATITVE